MRNFDEKGNRNEVVVGGGLRLCYFVVVIDGNNYIEIEELMKKGKERRIVRIIFV